MKKRGGYLKKFLSLLITAGLIAAAILFYLGYDKAAQAETEHHPVAELYAVYVGDNPENLTFGNTDIVSAVIDRVVAENSFYDRFLTAFGDHTAASLLVKEVYLPDDEFISTTIAQRILIQRLEKAYSADEILLIYCYVMGYQKDDIATVAALLAEGKSESLKDLLNIDSSLIDDILTFLTEKGFLTTENAAAIEEKLP